MALLESVMVALNDFFSGLVSKFIVAIIIVLLGFIIGKILGKIVHKLLLDFRFDNIMKRAIGFKMPFSEFFGRAITIAAYFASVFMALTHLGISTTIFKILLGLMFLLVVVLMYIELVHFFPNFMAHVHIARKMKIHEGDAIKFGTVSGTIKEITLTETMIETKEGDTIYVPNNLLRKSIVHKKH